MSRIPKLTADERRTIIAATKCPTCDAPRNSKCVNPMIAFGISKQTKRDRNAANWNCRYFYGQYVHAARFRAFRRLQKRTATSEENR